MSVLHGRLVERVDGAGLGVVGQPLRADAVGQLVERGGEVLACLRDLLLDALGVVGHGAPFGMVGALGLRAYPRAAHRPTPIS